jgi:hypothetical protein
VGWAALLLGISASIAVIAWLLRRRAAAFILVNVAAVLLGVAIFETYLVITAQRGDGTRFEGSINDGFTETDDLLGYKPRNDAHVTARKFFADTLLYDVTYTIGPDGLRVSPKRDLQQEKGCVVFFGDSITFGEGLNDTETYPFRVGSKTNGAYAIYNFAFSGYGPHQMLANLEGGRVQEQLHCTPTQFVYLMIPEHLERVAGLATWDKHGPRFTIRLDGSVQRDGNFDRPYRLLGRWPIPQRLGAALDSFHTWQKLFGRDRQASADALPLAIAIVNEAAGFSRQRYPQSSFDVILWDGNDGERVRGLEAGLTAAGIPVHRITRAIPDFRNNWRAYVISEHDLHPNARQHELLANLVVGEILHVTPTEAAQ